MYDWQPGPRRCAGDARGGWRRLLVDRDALLHRYTVAVVFYWRAGGLACAFGGSGGVVSKGEHGSGVRNDIGCDGVNASRSSR